MTTKNGKVPAEAAAAAVKQSEWQPRMYRLTTDELTGRDMKRARVVLKGRDPWELTDDMDERFTLIIWCLKSRHFPGFTWEQAEDTPFGEFLPPSEVPPPTPASESSGNSETTPAGKDSSETPQSTAPERSSEVIST